jgi:hypothetical protein
MASVLANRPECSGPRSITGAIEELLLVPTYSSRLAPATIAAHRGMALPLQLTGQAYRWSMGFGGSAIDLVGIGRRKLIEPLLAQLFGELPKARREARRVVWNPAGLASSGADVIAAEVHRWMAARFRRSGWVIVPEAVRWQGELSQVPPSQPHHSLTQDLRKVRKHGYSVLHTTVWEDWQEFYGEMVLPQARSRHGDTAWLPSPRLMAEFATRGTLHLIIKDGVRVAGACSIPRGDTLWLPLSGIRHGNPVLLRDGAGTAALALTLEWARASGYRRVDAGRTGPFVNDGLQQFKRKWGLSPTPDPLAHLAAVWTGTPAARQAFSRNPVLIEDGTGLRVYAGQPE